MTKAAAAAAGSARTAERKLTFVMPVLNEEQYLATAVHSVFEQKLPKGWIAELVLALGPSKDETDRIAQELANRSDAAHRVLTVANPSGGTSTGLNAAIHASHGEYVVRVDAHSRLEPGYVARAIRLLEANPSYANVGGQMVAEGRTPFQSAVAWAYMSRWGIGGARYHVGGEAGPAESVYLGVFRRSIFETAGYFDPRFTRGQDWELNRRIRDAGGVVWFDPELRVHYFPRSNWWHLAKQFFRTGVWRGKLSRPDLVHTNPRYLMPPLLALFSLLGAPFLVYLLAVGLIALTAKPLSQASKLGLLLALPVMHLSWGWGFILGVLFPQLDEK